MLTISPHIVGQIVLLRHEIGRSEGEIRGLIEGLNEDQQADLVALMWIGRGSFEPEDLAEAIATAKAEATTPTADYLLGSPHLADHLESALDALGIDVTDIEDDLM